MKALVKELNNRGYVAEEKDVVKNGVTLHGIMVGEGDVRPVIYPDPNTTADEIISQFERVKGTTFDLDSLKDSEYIKSHVYVGLQKSSSQDLVKKRTKYKGIEQYLYVKISDNACFKLTTEMIAEDVWNQAKANTFKETVVATMAQIMRDFGMDGPETPLYVVTNTAKYRGAANILDRKSLIKALGRGNFIVLPSSIHEMLILPAEEYDNLSDLAQMVREIIASQVAPSEQLGDTAYKITL